MSDCDISWECPRIGTCGEPVDKLRITVDRVRSIPDLIVGFDGERGGWVIGGSFRTVDGNDFEFREVAFIPQRDFNEDRFMRRYVMTVGDAVREYLKANGYDGLFNEDEDCACETDDLVQCGNLRQDCLPGYRVKCNCGEHDFHIQAEKG